MTEIEKAARMALEALKVVWNEHPAIDALTAALEQPTTGIKQVIELYDSPEQPEQDSRYCLNCEALSKELAAIKTTQQEPVSIKSAAQKVGAHLPDTYIPSMDDAIAAGDSVLMNEQAELLRECRAALDSLIAQKPTLAGLLCGSTTLGNLRAELGAYRPQGVFGATPQPANQPRQWQGLTADEIWNEWLEQSKPERDTHNFVAGFARAIETKLKEKNT